MNNQQCRDDSFKDRLSSFLLAEGNLKVQKIKQMKTNIFYLETDQGDFILRGKRSKQYVVQQSQFFKKINLPIVNTFAKFGNDKIMVEGFGLYWTLVRYIKGKQLDFKKENDRQDALSVIRKFHHVSEGIEIDAPLLKLPLYIRWYQRINKLRQTKESMTKYGFGQLYKDIITVSESRLAYFSSFDWGKIENTSVQRSMWIHGDVASHNFIRGLDGTVHMIDFDLLSLSPQIYEYIQLGQRFLPYVDWDMNHLIRYFSWLDDQSLQVWLAGMTIPTDLVREWWRFTLRNPSDEEYSSYLHQLSNEWMKRLRFVEQVENMLT